MHNLLIIEWFVRTGADGCFAKIGDLGFAKIKTTMNALRTQAGTQLYMVCACFPLTLCDCVWFVS